MSASTIARPTERLALRGGRKRQLPSIGTAFAGLALAERAGDLHGAMLCRRLVQRIARNGRVGE